MTGRDPNLKLHSEFINSASTLRTLFFKMFLTTRIHTLAIRVFAPTPVQASGQFTGPPSPGTARFWTLGEQDC